MAKIMLTVSEELKKEIRSKAGQADKSMNQYIIDCINHPIIKVTNPLTEKQLLEWGNKMEDYHKKLKQPTPSKCEHEWIFAKDSRGEGKKCLRCNEFEIAKEVKPTKKPKEYGYPKSRSLGKKIIN